MAEMRRPMDFWKGLVRLCYRLSNGDYDSSTGVGASNRLCCLYAIWLLRLRTSQYPSSTKALPRDVCRDTKGNLRYPWHTRV